MSGRISFNPRRLTLARKRRGMTMTRLAERVGVEPRTVSGWEHGEFEPEDDRLQQIASELRFPKSFFEGDDLEEPSPQGASFRAFTRMTAAQRGMALGAGAMGFLLNTWIEKRFELPPADLPDLGRGLGPEDASDSLRHYWGLGEQPIKNMVHLLEAKGVRVFSLAIDAAEVDAFSVWHGGRPFVFLNTTKSAEHSRFDAAHELAHLVMHRHGVPQGRTAEHEANGFAAAFLMPKRNVLANAPKLPTVQHLVKAKKYWGVSVAALACRLSAIKVITEWHYRSLFIEIAKRGFRKHEPEEAQREMSQVMTKVFSALRDDGITKADISAQLGIPEEEIESLVFGLALTSINGAGPWRVGRRPSLRVVSSRG